METNNNGRLPPPASPLPPPTSHLLPKKSDEVISVLTVPSAAARAKREASGRQVGGTGGTRGTQKGRQGTQRDPRDAKGTQVSNKRGIFTRRPADRWRHNTSLDCRRCNLRSLCYLQIYISYVHFFFLEHSLFSRFLFMPVFIVWGWFYGGGGVRGRGRRSLCVFFVISLFDSLLCYKYK